MLFCKEGNINRCNTLSTSKVFFSLTGTNSILKIALSCRLQSQPTFSRSRGISGTKTIPCTQLMVEAETREDWNENGEPLEKICISKRSIETKLQEEGPRSKKEFFFNIISPRQTYRKGFTLPFLGNVFIQKDLKLMFFFLLTGNPLLEYPR